MRIATFVLFLVLVIYAGLGIFARPEIDDWCSMAATAEYGLWQSTALAYQTWTGRILYTVVTNVVAATQPYSGQIMPALLIFVTVAALRYAVAPFTKAPLLVSLAFSYALLQGPNLWQVFYIPSAVLNYLPPLLSGVVLASWLYRHYWESRPAALPKGWPS